MRFTRNAVKALMLLCFADEEQIQWDNEVFNALAKEKKYTDPCGFIAENQQQGAKVYLRKLSLWELIKRYSLFCQNGELYGYGKSKKGGEPVLKQVICNEDAVDKVFDIHLEKNHLGIQNIFGIIKESFIGIPRSIIDDALASCPECNQRRVKVKAPGTSNKTDDNIEEDIIEFNETDDLEQGTTYEVIQVANSSELEGYLQNTNQQIYYIESSAPQSSGIKTYSNSPVSLPNYIDASQISQMTYIDDSGQIYGADIQTIQTHGVGIQAPWNSTVQAHVNSQIQAPVNSTVQAPVNFRIQAHVTSQIQAPGNSQIQTPGNSQIQAPFNSQIQAPVNSIIQGPINSQIQAPGSSKIQARVNSTIQGPVKSQIQAPVNSTMQAPVHSKLQAPVNSKIQAPVNAKIQTPVKSEIQASNRQSTSKPTQTTLTAKQSSATLPSEHNNDGSVAVGSQQDQSDRSEEQNKDMLPMEQSIEDVTNEIPSDARPALSVKRVSFNSVGIRFTPSTIKALSILCSTREDQVDWSSEVFYAVAKDRSYTDPCAFVAENYFQRPKCYTRRHALWELVKRYSLFCVNGELYGYGKATKDGKQVAKLVICYEEAVTKVKEIHLEGKHLGIQNLYKIVKQKYIGVTRQIVTDVIDACEDCRKQIKVKNKERLPHSWRGPFTNATKKRQQKTKATKRRQQTGANRPALEDFEDTTSNDRTEIANIGNSSEINTTGNILDSYSERPNFATSTPIPGKLQTSNVSGKIQASTSAVLPGTAVKSVLKPGLIQAASLSKTVGIVNSSSPSANIAKSSNTMGGIANSNSQIANNAKSSNTMAGYANANSQIANITAKIANSPIRLTDEMRARLTKNVKIANFTAIPSKLQVHKSDWESSGSQNSQNEKSATPQKNFNHTYAGSQDAENESSVASLLQSEQVDRKMENRSDDDSCTILSAVDNTEDFVPRKTGPPSGKRTTGATSATFTRNTVKALKLICSSEEGKVPWDHQVFVDVGRERKFKNPSGYVAEYDEQKNRVYPRKNVLLDCVRRYGLVCKNGDLYGYSVSPKTGKRLTKLVVCAEDAADKVREIHQQKHLIVKSIGIQKLFRYVKDRYIGIGRRTVEQVLKECRKCVSRHMRNCSTHCSKRECCKHKPASTADFITNTQVSDNEEQDDDYEPPRAVARVPRKAGNFAQLAKQAYIASQLSSDNHNVTSSSPKTGVALLSKISSDIDSTESHNQKANIAHCSPISGDNPTSQPPSVKIVNPAPQEEMYTPYAKRVINITPQVDSPKEMSNSQPIHIYLSNTLSGNVPRIHVHYASPNDEQAPSSHVFDLTSSLTKSNNEQAPSSHLTKSIFGEQPRMIKLLSKRSSSDQSVLTKHVTKPYSNSRSVLTSHVNKHVTKPNYPDWWKKASQTPALIWRSNSKNTPSIQEKTEIIQESHDSIIELSCDDETSDNEARETQKSVTSLSPNVINLSPSVITVRTTVTSGNNNALQYGKLQHDKIPGTKMAADSVAPLRSRGDFKRTHDAETVYVDSDNSDDEVRVLAVGRKRRAVSLNPLEEITTIERPRVIGESRKKKAVFLKTDTSDPVPEPPRPKQLKPRLCIGKSSLNKDMDAMITDGYQPEIFRQPQSSDQTAHHYGKQGTSLSFSPRHPLYGQLKSTVIDATSLRHYGFESSQSATSFRFFSLAGGDKDEMIIEKGICVDRASNVTVSALGRKLPNHHPLWSTLYTCRDLKALQTLIQRLSYMAVCVGNEESDYIHYFCEFGRSKYDYGLRRLSGYIDTYFSGAWCKTVRSNSCQLILPPSKIIGSVTVRCGECDCLRRTIDSRIEFLGRESRENLATNDEVDCEMTANEHNSATMKELKRENVTLKKRLFYMKRTVKRLQTNANTLAKKRENEMALLEANFQKELGLLSLRGDKEMDKFGDRDSFLRIFCDQQLHMQSNEGGLESDYHPSLMKWCSELRAISPKAFRFVRETFDLPSSNTLSDYARKRSQQLFLTDSLEQREIRSRANVEQSETRPTEHCYQSEKVIGTKGRVFRRGRYSLPYSDADNLDETGKLSETGHSAIHGLDNTAITKLVQCLFSEADIESIEIIPTGDSCVRQPEEGDSAGTNQKEDNSSVNQSEEGGLAETNKKEGVDSCSNESMEGDSAGINQKEGADSGANQSMKGDFAGTNEKEGANSCDNQSMENDVPGTSQKEDDSSVNQSVEGDLAGTDQKERDDSGANQSMEGDLPGTNQKEEDDSGVNQSLEGDLAGTNQKEDDSSINQSVEGDSAGTNQKGVDSCSNQSMEGDFAGTNQREDDSSVNQSVEGDSA